MSNETAVCLRSWTLRFILPTDAVAGFQTFRAKFWQRRALALGDVKTRLSGGPVGKVNDVGR
jgi:hypothetical protein